jgi:hypothetical protein
VSTVRLGLIAGEDLLFLADLSIAPTLAQLTQE